MAISGTKGSAGFGSQRRELIERRTFEMVRAGDHWSFRMSRQIAPVCEEMLGCLTFVRNFIFGGSKG